MFQNLKRGIKLTLDRKTEKQTDKPTNNLQTGQNNMPKMVRFGDIKLRVYIELSNIFSQKKETVGWNKVDNSYNIQRIIIKS